MQQHQTIVQLLKDDFLVTEQYHIHIALSSFIVNTIIYSFEHTRHSIPWKLENKNSLDMQERKRKIVLNLTLSLFFIEIIDE